ncbi:unnamed protein product [Clonostachys byssicola]|uniref:Uncharacterized protein n=1 Tax=Clonostachys byssicola TaxID=160290 RepID=A0A9N9UYC9_9HYPO|nr:unnamed protein product [Clonostachys byssicola]
MPPILGSLIHRLLCMMRLGQDPRLPPRSTTLGLGLAGYSATFDTEFLRRHYLGSSAEPPLARNATSPSTTQQPSPLGATAEAPGIDRQDVLGVQPRVQPTANSNLGPDQAYSKAGGEKRRLPQPAEQNNSRLSMAECLERARQLRTEVLEGYSQRIDDGTVSVQVENARWSLGICHMRCGDFAEARDLMALVVKTRAGRLGKDAKKTIDAQTQLEYLDMLLTDSRVRGSLSPAGEDSSICLNDSNSSGEVHSSI